jgi:hypothetical protein
VLGERDSASVGPVDALVAACQLGEDAILVFANAQRFWNDPQVAQAIWNLRDVFKTPGAVLPDELTRRHGKSKPAPQVQASPVQPLPVVSSTTCVSLAMRSTFPAARDTLWLPPS